MPNWLPYLAVLLVFELASDVAAKQFALTGRHAWMAGAMALVLCGNLSWQLMLRAGMDLSRGGILFAVGVGVGVVAIGVLGYGEPLGARHAAGLALGLCAIALLA